MGTQNKYEDMSVLDALKYVKNQNMLLPDIQREYVWEYWEIENLFESIVDDYPVGSCIFWNSSCLILYMMQMTKMQIKIDRLYHKLVFK